MNRTDEQNLRQVLSEVEEAMSGYKPKFIGLYILEGHEPVPVSDTLAWAQWFENAANRRLASDHINGWHVSTVFLGIDNACCYILGGIPLLFETMIFSDTELIDTPLLKHKFHKSLDNYTRRYASWDEAMAGHNEVLAIIREGAL